MRDGGCHVFENTNTWPMPEETGRIGKRILEEHDPYRLISDQLFEK
jgi:hypothetical protein